MLFVLHCKILTGKKKKKGFSLKWLLLASQTTLMGVTNPYVLKNVVSFVLLTNPWSFQIAKDLFIDFFSLPEWNVSSYFKLNSCRILTGKSPWKKCGLFHHAHVINKINIRAYNLHHHYLTIPLWESLYIFTNIFDALYLDYIYIPYTIVEINMHYYCCSVAKSCLTLCKPKNCHMPGLPVHHHLLELAHTRVHRVCDAIQPAHPLSPPSPFGLKLIVKYTLLVTFRWSFGIPGGACDIYDNRCW